MSNSNLYNVLSGLHANDGKINDKVNNILTGLIGLTGAVSGSSTSLFSGGSLFDPETEKLNPEYNSMKVASIDKPDGQDSLKKIKFIGDCKVTYGPDGNLVIRIGENLNSSNFNNNDGYTDLGPATASGTISGGAITGTPASDFDGVSQMLKSPASTIAIVSGNNVHFDNNLSTTFEVTAYVGKDATPSSVFTFGPITDSGNYKGKDEDENEVNAILYVTGFSQETKTADGATGFCADVKLEISTTAIDDIAKNQDIYFVVKHINEQEDTKPYTTNKVFVVDNAYDNVKPSISGDIYFAFTETATKTYSGITYITAGNAVVSGADIYDINSPGYVSSNNVCVDFNKMIIDGCLTATKTGNASTDTGSFTGTFTSLADGYYSDVKVSVKAKNCNDWGSVKDSAVLAGPFNVETVKNETNSDTVIHFANETNRLKSDFTEFDSTASTDNSTDLIITRGNLQYPASSMYGHTFDQTATRNYIYKFKKAGSLPGGTITIKSSDSPETYLKNGSMKLEVSRDGSVWFDIAFISNETNIGKSNSTWGKTSYVVFGFGDGTDAVNGMYFRISMNASCTLTISEISFA